MTFRSVLFSSGPAGIRPEVCDAPACFGDLNLDQVVEAITAHKQDYDLEPFFYAPLSDTGVIEDRQAVFRDLEQEDLFAQVEAFANEMQAMRRCLAQADKLHYRYQKERWFLQAVSVYAEAVRRLARDLSVAELKSRGLAAFRDDLLDYARSAPFASLVADIRDLLTELASVRYTLQIKDLSVRVRKYEAEIDHSAEVLATFANFQRGIVKDYAVTFPDGPDMNHVEAGVLDLVAKLYPEVFAHLDAFSAANAGFLAEGVQTFDREIQFYLAFLEHVACFRRAGLQVCYPHVSATDKAVYDLEGYDLALAHKLIGAGAPVVCNDFGLTGPERFIVVTGPNQGGKTTFARAFGQLHYLASLGCPVPGRAAQLFLFDQLFTHFERQEATTNLRGKLQDDLMRIHAILEQATPSSLVILNEIFTSTTLSDAIFLSRNVLDRLLQLDALGVCVTFIDELASLSEKTVSLVSGVAPDNPTVRTYKLVRRPADGLAYAWAIAEKYRLTYAALRERLTP
jgi:DNA mismatch repair protein MutS